MGRLEGKRALITGAGQGIGRATALAFSREGAQVVATDRNEQAVAALADEGTGIEARRLDVTATGEIASLAAALRAPDVLFNCAGYVHHGSLLDCEEEDFDFSFELNVKSMYRMLRAFLPGMLEAGGGSIINMASVVSSEIGAPNRFVYGASKAAVIGLTRSVAVDFVGRGIRCNAIAPATVESPSLEQRMQATGDPVASRAAFVARQPLGRIGRPEEIAALAVYLASDESSYTTGVVHRIDGGWSNQ